MFTWICPQCGREVPPAYTECPNCTPKGATGAPPESPAATADSPQGSAAPPQTPPAAVAAPPSPQRPVFRPPPPANQQPQVARRPARAGLPTWLLTILFAFAFLGLGAGVYWTVGYFRGSSPVTATPSSTVESPAAKPGAKTNALQKYIEVSGIRFTEDAKKRLMVKFTLTNHSDADISGLAGNATMWGRTQKSEEDAVGTFSFTTNVSPQASQELTAPLTTKLKVYELPDWQNVTTDLQITAPQ